ncbi:hypothetical protein BRD56_05560 [Thermoplasmatales archaeon SW_10_69_26]|nr:MAG: hypothetical protein BRD56_05560 [Thermoplasmatales archaeon SW_10_69_26]
MRGPRSVWSIATLAVALLAVAVGGHALQGAQAPLSGEGSHYVQVVQTDGSGVVAGLVTETTEGPLGLSSDRSVADEGWVIVHPEDVEARSEVELREEIPFEDPNGGSWMEREVAIGTATAWTVPVGQPREDASLDGPYNFAVVVDWDQVPEDSDLTTTYVDEISFVE